MPTAYKLLIFLNFSKFYNKDATNGKGTTHVVPFPFGRRMDLLGRNELPLRRGLGRGTAGTASLTPPACGPGLGVSGGGDR